MPLTPEQIEDRLKNLERETRQLRGAVERKVNPFESIEIQLALENGHTVSARTRLLPMSLLGVPDIGLTGQLIFPDGSTTRFHAAIPIPADWVVGTALTLVTLLHKGGVGIETAVLNSWISSTADTETWTWNIESSTSVNRSIPASAELEKLTRTITASTVAAGETIEWLLQRVGGDGSDTLNEALFIHGVWLEYTAFF